MTRAAPAPALRGDHELLADAIDAAAEQLADREAYVDGERRVTFGEWITAARRVAGAMAERGVGPGDVVAILLPTSIDYAIAFAAAASLGAVTTGLNPRLGPREVAAICARAEPSVAVLDDGPAPRGLPEALPRFSRGELVASAHGTSPARAAPGRPGVRAGDPVTIVWTSGTTGLPKGAWFDHDNLRAAVATAGVMAAPFDRRLVSTPFAHAGYMAKLWEQLAWGITLVLSPTPWRADDAVRLIGTERVTVAGAVPAQWAKILEHPDLDRTDVGHLRLCVTATAPTPPELVEEVTRRLGAPLVVRYAMTESPSISGTDPGDPPEILYRTVGRPQAGLELAVRDETGASVGPGEVGRIHVRGTCVMRGYWRDPERTAEALDAKGWLRTGDLGRLDQHGNLVLAGRAGDMYIRGGYNVYPLEVEHVLAEHPGVEAAAVLGAAAPVLGEVGVAFVVPAPGTVTPALAELRTWVKDRLADYKAPDQLVVLDALPLTSMMKVDKLALRSSLADRGGAASL